MREVAIIGAGMIKFGKFPQYAAAKMGGDAGLMALEQAGIKPTQIQATFLGNIGNPPNLAQRVNGEIGVERHAVDRFECGDVSAQPLDYPDEDSIMLQKIFGEAVFFDQL